MTPRKGAPVVCAESACGLPEDDLDEGDPLMNGWIQARVAGSREPSAWYCSVLCAARGIAAAERDMSP